MIIRKYPLGPLETNCYLVCSKNEKKAAIIDPGDKSEEILNFLETEGYKLEYIINTHSHFDHIGGNKYFAEKTGAQIAAHKKEWQLIEAGGGAANFGMPFAQSPKPSVDLADIDILTIGDLKLKVLYTPGHTQGEISLYHQESKSLFCGDVLFYRSIGRTDLPGGNQGQLLASIKVQLFTLPDDTIAYCGHGPETTIGEEKKENPWIRG